MEKINHNHALFLLHPILSVAAKEGINDFCEIITDTLQDFNRIDIHTTPEGKAAYNCRIRFFLIYLYEQGMVCNPYLYKALPTMSAPRTVIVQTLSPEDFI